MSMLCWLCNKVIPESDAAEHACCKAAPVDGERERLIDFLAVRRDDVSRNSLTDSAVEFQRWINLINDMESQISALRALLNVCKQLWVPADNWLHTDIDALLIPSAASIGEGGLGDAGREMK